MEISIRRIFQENNEPIKYLSVLALTNSDIRFIYEALQTKSYPHIRVIHWGKQNEEVLNGNPNLKKAIQTRLLERLHGHRLLSIFVQDEEQTKKLSDLKLTESDLNVIKNELRKFPYIFSIDWGEENEKLVNSHPEVKSFIDIQFKTNAKNQEILNMLIDSGEPVKDCQIELTIDHLNLICDELLKHARHVHWIVWGEKNQELLNSNQQLNAVILDRLIDNIMYDRDNQLVIDLSKFEIDLKFLECLIKKLDLNTWVGGVFWGKKNEHRLMSSEQEKSLMSRIGKKLAENNKNYKRFPSDYVYCLLASCCRNPKDRDLSEKITNLGWEIETKFDYLTIPKTVLKDLIINIGGPIQRETKSAAILYKNRSSRQLVLAYRGIIIEDVSGLFKDDESNLVDQNVYGVLGKEITTLSYYSYIFAKHAFELSMEMNFSLSFTGYSFGAWLAEQSVFFCYNELKSSEVKAVTFDSPGSLEIIKKLFSTNVVDLYISEEQLIRALNIKTYLLSPNFVNTANEHLGKVYRLYESFEDEKKASKDINSFIEEKIIEKIPSKRLKKKLKKWYETKVANDLKSYAFFLNGLRSLFTDDLGWILSLFDEKSGQVKEIERLRRVKNWPKMNFMPRSDKFKEIEVFGFDVGNVFPLASKIVGVLTTPLNLAFNFGMETFAKSYFSKGLFFFNLIVEFLNGSIEANECISYYKYSLKVISSHDETGTTILDKDMFKLVYIGNYATETVNLRSEKLNLRYIDNDKEIYDYYYGIQERYDRFPNLEEQLKSLKKSIKLTINSAMYATSMDLASPKETDVESVKEKFWRLFKLYDAYEKAYQIYKSNEDFKVVSDNFDELQSDESFIEIDESTFKDIDDLLETNALMYIYGPIGSGKTTLAKQYRFHRKTSYISFFILSSERLNYNLQEIHLRLFGTYYLNNSTEVTATDGILLDKIKRKINGFSANSLLFIFDEVKNLSEIEPIINANTRQKLIITTKDQSIFEGYSTDIKGIKAETFDLDRSTEYLKKRLISDQFLLESATLLRMDALIPELTQADEWSQAIEEISKTQELSACILKIGVWFCEMNPEWKVDQIKDMLINKSYYNIIDPMELNVLTHLAYLDGSFINLELIKHLFIEQLYSIDDVLNNLVKIGFLQKIQRDLYEEAEFYYIMPETIQNELKETLIENNEEKRRILTKLTFVLNKSINYEIGELKKYTISMLESINKHARKLINEEWENKSKDENLLMLLIKVERINNEIFHDYEESKKLLLKIIEFEKGLKPLKYAKLANLLIKIGTISQNQNNLDESLEYFEDALIMINELNSQELGEVNQYQEQTCHLLNQIGTIYFKHNKYNEALKYYEMALSDMSKDDRNAKSAIYNNIGLIHEKMGESIKSIEAFQKAIELAENSKSDSDNDLVSYLNNLGNVYLESEKYDEAQVCYERALSINRERNKPNDIAVTYRNIGSIYLKKDQIDKALDYYSNALENVESDRLEKTRILTSIGNLYKSKELYQEALNSYEKALDIIKEINDDSSLADLYHKISLVYHSLNEFDKAAENWEEARKIREKLNDIDELSEIEKIKF